ncbi:MAG: hypothetical protein LBQ98_08670 [Nitrososphaerota archaeon]|nr:hypothetical protein [Nitrososphaerota archaeon]
MLDYYVWMSNMSRYDQQVIKSETGSISVNNDPATEYYPNGTIVVNISVDDRTKNGTLCLFYPDGHLKQEIITNRWPEELRMTYPNGTMAHFYPPVTTVTYYPSGDITVLESPDNIFYTRVNGSERISQMDPLEVVWNRNPIKNCDDAARAFESETAYRLQTLKDSQLPFFTADYGLYWWDYRSGYDMVLAELGWNNTVAQEIGLVRGAATLQGKNWGTILTWTYSQWPYLAMGDVIYDQMQLAYECGADYVVVFNYAEDTNEIYGTLQNEHFQALERFWFEVVKNDNIEHGGIKAEAALVLPRNYGWGMRHPQDSIWGIWNANSTSQQIWAQVQNKLTQYGPKLDIIYDDPTYPN